MSNTTQPIVPVRQDPASVHLAKELSAAYAATKQGLRRAIYFGYLCLEAKEQVKHGQFEDWLTAHCPEIPHRTARHFMQITEGVHGQLPKRQQLPFSKTRELLSFPDDELPKDAEPVRDAIFDLIDGKSQRQIMITLKSNSPSGGFRPPEEAVQKWLKKNHPELVGAKFADLPEPLRKQFQKQWKPEAPSAAMTVEGHRAFGRKLLDDITAALDRKRYAPWDDALVAAIKDAANDLSAQMVDLQKKRKGTKK